MRFLLRSSLKQSLSTDLNQLAASIPTQPASRLLNVIFQKQNLLAILALCILLLPGCAQQQSNTSTSSVKPPPFISDRPSTRETVADTPTQSLTDKPQKKHASKTESYIEKLKRAPAKVLRWASNLLKKDK